MKDILKTWVYDPTRPSAAGPLGWRPSGAQTARYRMYEGRLAMVQKGCDLRMDVFPRTSLLDVQIQGNWYPPKKLKYVKPRLRESDSLNLC